ncbi:MULTISPECIES: hypothetical protein [unclassified Neisseria]|nr:MULTISPECIES: hypothetical protein [unclassified Neisseria]MBF0804672.1 hypothetical protein [Neisseria sp. 19428wB4_WF04]
MAYSHISAAALPHMPYLLLDSEMCKPTIADAFLSRNRPSENQPGQIK